MDYSDPAYSYNTVAPAELWIMGVMMFMFMMLFMLPTIVALWRIFTKAGRPGWWSLVPLYNNWVLFEISGRPGWWSLLLLIPIVNIVAMVILAIDLAKAFGHSSLFGFLCNFLFQPVGWWLIGFEADKYVGGQPADPGNLMSPDDTPSASGDVPEPAVTHPASSTK